MFDLPLSQLELYAPKRREPTNFDAFWADTLAQARQHPLNAQFTPIEVRGIQLVQVYDVSFAGYGGQTIKGWFFVPRGASGPLPCVVEYIGYGGGRGYPLEWMSWSVAGYAHFVMDTRGQGSSWRVGDTPDYEPEGSNPQYPGFMTRGILNPDTYYYRRVFTDAVRAVEAARSHPLVDASRIAVTGGSQGGGIAIASGALSENVSLVMPDVPFLCHYEVAMQLVESHPYSEITNYCKTHRDKVAQVMNTLTYFDGVNFAARATGKALFSVGLMDEICPPRTVYAAYNHYAGEKQIEVYPYNHHEGGGVHQSMAKFEFVADYWG